MKSSYTNTAVLLSIKIITPHLIYIAILNLTLQLINIASSVKDHVCLYT